MELVRPSALDIHDERAARLMIAHYLHRVGCFPDRSFHGVCFIRAAEQYAARNGQSRCCSEFRFDVHTFWLFGPCVSFSFGASIL